MVALHSHMQSLNLAELLLGASQLCEMPEQAAQVWYPTQITVEVPYDQPDYDVHLFQDELQLVPLCAGRAGTSIMDLIQEKQNRANHTGWSKTGHEWKPIRQGILKKHAWP